MTYKENYESMKRQHDLLVLLEKQTLMTDVLLMTLILVALVCCTFSAVTNLVDGDYFWVVVFVALSVINIVNGVLTVRRMVKNMKLMKRESELFAELEREFLELVEKENELGYDEIQ